VILVYGGIQWQMPPPNLDTFATLPNKRSRRLLSLGAAA
jgi:hypothetical protein